MKFWIKQGLFRFDLKNLPSFFSLLFDIVDIATYDRKKAWCSINHSKLSAISFVIFDIVDIATYNRKKVWYSIIHSIFSAMYNIMMIFLWQPQVIHKKNVPVLQCGFPIS